uniref:Protein kinase domain-containing protein n=1 Tax=Haptolina brevifila TaxID=156173 RepID=A0A7S2IE47_9EUKA|mmetsp:Transcript_65190/g.128983  ORF Transcript_65190/g.128983 Transcript_65190/m.128983 type:complete len:617 (+) Transcript_65190:1226-3076(+)
MSAHGGMCTCMHACTHSLTSTGRRAAPQVGSACAYIWTRPTDEMAPSVRREVRVLARVQHPNVVRLFGVCLRPVVRVVLPLADGSLRDAISDHRDAISAQAAVALLCGIARGMAAIHAHAILHLDLKPENVLLSHGEPWVTDFGLATSQAIGSVSALSSVAQRGTARYKAPELFRLRRQGGALVSTAADVYSFALIMWELAVGEVPWAGMSDVEVMANVMAGERPLLESGEEWEARARPDMRELIKASWVQDTQRVDAQVPSERPSFAALVSSLEAMLEDQAIPGQGVEASSSTLPSFTPRGTPIPLAVLATEGARPLAWAVPVGGTPADRLEQMELTVMELLAQVAALEAAQIASEVERTDVHEEVKGLRTALKTAEADARRLEALAGETAAMQVRQVLLRAEQREVELRTEMQAMIDKVGQALQEALGEKSVDCPKLPWVHGGAGGWYRLFFVCPVALEVAETNGGNGYKLLLPKAALHKLSPALHTTIHALRSKLGCGRAVGLPIQHKANRSMAAVLAKEVAAVDALERSLPPVEGPRMASQPLGVVPKEAYQMLLTTLETEDPGLTRCGLVRLTAPDGTVAWVRPGAAAERFRLEGKHTLGRVDVVPQRLLA